MIIGIDAREGAREQRAGKGEYVYQLVSHLIKQTEQRFVLFLDMDPPLEWRRDNVRWVIRETNAFLWQLEVFWYLEFLRPVDVYFSPTSLILPAVVRSVPVVTAVMDFVSFLFPERHQPKAVVLEQLWMRPALRYSKKLIAISEHTKQDAIKLFKVDPAKIQVTYLAASLAEREEACDLPQPPLILCVGTLEPRKNLERVVAAFNLIKPDIPAAQLVMVGRWGWQSESIRQAIATSPFSSDIHILNRVTAAQKTFIYRQAQVLAFPSLYEGFGLPPLEAMAMGVPVVASRVASIPEVVGDAGLLVDPTSVEEIAQAIKRVLQDPGLAGELQTKGRARAQLFTWDKTAARTLSILYEVGQ